MLCIFAMCHTFSQYFSNLSDINEVVTAIYEKRKPAIFIILDNFTHMGGSDIIWPNQSSRANG